MRKVPSTMRVCEVFFTVLSFLSDLTASIGKIFGGVLPTFTPVLLDKY